MGRPKLLRPDDGGEVVLKNCTAETVAKIQAALEGAPAPTEITVVAASAPVAVGAMTEVAIGVFQDKTTLSYHTAKVKYNPYNKSAIVDKIENCGSPEVAAEKFKVLAVKNNLV